MSAVDAETAARTVCDAIAASSAVLARIWVADPGGWLHLVASAGFPVGGGTYQRTDGEFSRVRITDGKIGQIARAREPLVVRDVRGDEEWLANPDWIARQGVRAFAGFPLLAHDVLVGVLALFTRTPLTDDAIAELGFVADFTAVRLHALNDAVRVKLLTRQELRALEKQSIENALALTGGKVFGPRGAAALLGMKPTTLASRIKVLGMQ